MSVLARHPVTKNVVVLHNNVALVNADTELDAIVLRYSSIFLTHPLLPLGRTTQCINHTRKFHRQALVPNDIPIYGYIYDVKSGKLIEVPEAATARKAI